MTYLVCPDTPAVNEYATVHIAWELSKADWKLGVIVPGAKTMSRYAIKGGDLAAAAARLAAIRAKAGKAGLPVRILSCYEAGFEGHWLHRWLEGQGVASHEIDPSSIEVNRRARRAKTDRIDLERLMRAFLAHLRGEPKACSLVHVPRPAEEDDKRPSRERERLLKERTAHTNRIKALLHGQGVRDAKPLTRDFLTRLKDIRTGDGRPLPPRLAAEIAREHERLVLADKQIAAIEVYRSFANRRQVGACFGMTGTPYSSGEEERDQGISKAGNRRARAMAVELAWRWVFWQPDSELSRWFKARVGDAKGRVRRIAIVAVARKLMVALWRYLETGVVPDGAVLHPSF